MFERYAEKARRVIFFARHEASLFGSPYIQPAHLLLGPVREDKVLASQFLPPHAAEAIREQIEARTTKGERISTSVDLPLNADSTCVLVWAADEAPALGEIGTAHLLLGILHLENNLASQILHGYGLSLELVREKLQRAVPTGGVKRVHTKPTACRDCKHLIVDGSTTDWATLFCAASPRKPDFDCYSGESRVGEPDVSPAGRYQLCCSINFGNCRLFHPKEG